MKLFGNKKNAGYVNPNQKKKRNHLWIIPVCIAGLLLAGFAAVRIIVQPVKITQPSLTKSQDVMVKKTRVQLNVETGQEETVETEEPAAHLDGVYNILLCGTDNDGYRTDTIIIAHMDTNQHRAALLSIPRDTVVENGQGGIRKINSVYAGGKEEGMLRLSKMLSNMLGFEMDGYLLVDLTAFKEAVDLVGGVNFDVPQDMKYDDPTRDLHIDLKAGYQLLDGEHAMQLVRFRKGYASQDIQRTKVQQDFLLALADQTVRVDNISKIADYAKLFVKYVTTDMTVGNLLYFAQQLTACDKESIQTYTAEGKGETIDGISYYPLFDWSLYEIVNEAFNPYDGKISQSSIHVITPDLALTYAEDYVPEDAEDQSEDEQVPPKEDVDPWSAAAEEEAYDTSEWEGGLTIENLERFENGDLE